MIATKIGFFCFPSAFGPLKIKMFSTFILYFFTQNSKILMFYIRYRSKCWYLFLKTALEAVGDENRPKCFKAYFIPLKLTNLWIFLHNYGQNEM